MGDNRAKTDEAAGREAGAVGRWGSAFAVALLLHCAAGVSILRKAETSGAVPDAPPAIPIELALASSAPDIATPTERGAEPTIDSAAPDPAENDNAAARPASVAAPPDEAPAPVAAASEAVLPRAARPTPRNPERPRAPPLDIRPPAARQGLAKRAAERAVRRAERRTGANESVAAAAAPNRGAVAAASAASAASSAAYRARLAAYLQSRLRYPGASSQAGVARIALSISRSGQVLSVRLSSSTGDGRLDAAAIAASSGTVPPPPADYTGDLSFNVPMRFRPL